MKHEKIGNIYTSTDYEAFETLKGNRNVGQKRVNKIKASINEIGYVEASPIVVNEKMEIIDGQGRFEACKQLELPIYYSIQKGASIEHCINMNINSTTWQTSDYIESYASNGNQNYTRLKKLIDDYPNMTLSIILGCIKGGKHPSLLGNEVRSGSFVLDNESFILTSEVLSYLDYFVETINEQISGNKANLYLAIAWVYMNYDNKVSDRIKDVICGKRFTLIPNITTVQSAYMFLEDEYNYRILGKNHIYFFSDYQKAQRDECGWYESRYMKKEK